MARINRPGRKRFTKQFQVGSMSIIGFWSGVEGATTCERPHGRGGFLLTVTVVLVLLLSPSMLALIGYPYDAEAGAEITKIHPCTFLVVALGALSLFRKSVSPKGRRIALFAIAAAIWWSVYCGVIGLPLAPPIVGALTPFMLMLALLEVNVDQRRRLAVIVHVVFVLDALIAIGELALNARLMPLVVAGKILTQQEGRFGALFGHPLENATIIGAYVVALASNIGNFRSILLPLGAMWVCALSMVAFGGRAATASMVLFGAVALLVKQPALFQRRNTGSRRAIVIVMVSVIITAAFFTALSTGLAENFLHRISNDSGSASTRLIALGITKKLDFSELLFGAKLTEFTILDEWGNQVKIGIEAFWLNVLYSCGLIVLLPIGAALIAALNRVRKEVNGNVGLVILYYLVVISGSISIAGKTMSLSIILIMLFAVCSFPETGSQLSGAPAAVRGSRASGQQAVAQRN